MPVCNTLVNPACLVGRAASALAGSAAGDILTAIAQDINDGIRWIVVNTATWWVQIPSPDLAGEPTVTAMQRWLLPVTAAVAIGGVIAAGARMALTRKASPLLDVTGGLLALAAAVTLGAALPALLLKAGDAWSAWILHAATGGQFTQRLTAILDLGGGAAPVVAVVFGIAAIVLTLVQAALMLLRQAALIILAGVLPLAAAGSVAPMTRPWIRKISSWMLALIFYKPAAAAVFAAAFTMIGSGGSPRTVLMGFVMLLLSVLTLPALLRFFTWTTGAVGGAAGGGQVFGAAAAGVIAVGALRGSRGAAGGGFAAQDQAAWLSPRGYAPPGTGSPGAAPTGPAAGAGEPAGANAAGTPAAWPPSASAAPMGSAAAANPPHASRADGPAGQTAPRATSSTGTSAPVAPHGRPSGATATATGAAGAGLAAGAHAAHAGAARAAGAMTPEEQR